MNSFELNKVIGAILLGGFVLLVSSILAGQLVQPHKSSIAMALPVGGTQPAMPPVAATLEPVSPLLAAADLAAGEAAFKKCTACHTIEKGAANKIGPNLWGVVGGAHAHRPDFTYSPALKGKPGGWDYEALNAWLHSPKTYAPGTKMAFAGIKTVQERANLIAWMRTQSDAPPPLPDAAAIEALKAASTAAAAPEAPETTTATPPAAEPTTGTEAPAAPATTEQPTTSGATTAAPAEAPAAPAAIATDGATATQTAATGGSLPDLLKAADPAAGQKIAAKCKACHDFTKGGPNKIGPNLWDIVGAKQAHLDTFKYSDAIKKLGKEWTYEELDKFLTVPKDYAPGTKMAFAGVKKPEERAALIAYLRTLSDSPKPLP